MSLTQEQRDASLATKLAYYIDPYSAMNNDSYTLDQDHTLDEIKKLATKKMKRTFRRHTQEFCARVYSLNVASGEGSSTIGFYTGKPTRTIDTCIDAYSIFIALNKA